MGRVDRRKVIAGFAALVANPVSRLHAAPVWPKITPTEAGFAPELETLLDNFVHAGRVRNVHGILVVRRGRMAAERYYEGDDQVRDGDGRASSARVVFAADRAHELRSVTKSIIGLLYGIALADGKVPALDQPLLAQFPQYTDLPDMAQRRRWTIAQAMTMTLGIDWDEEISYEDPRNSWTAMEAAPDRYRYVLEQPIVAVAGERWIYCGGATALVGKIIEKGVGRSVHDYARTVLFDPLGIGPTVWRSGRDGDMNFASGLAMLPRDLARIGQMLLDGGKAGERRIVPSDWLEAAFKPSIRIGESRHYGYHWYLGNAVFDGLNRRRKPWIAAFGNGGQRLYIYPTLDLVVVITAGNYNQRDQGSSPDRVINEVLLANLL